MIQKLWVAENRKTTICVDSYDSGVLKGRFYNLYQDMDSFDSLSQLLVKMESMLEETKTPQSYTSARTFSTILQPSEESFSLSRSRGGAKATFEVQVLFRQHSSWQGVIIWKERKVEQSFRSVLELILLMDSALRSLEGNIAV